MLFSSAPRERIVIRNINRILIAALVSACAGQPPASQPAPSTDGVKMLAGISLRDGWRAHAIVDRNDSIILTLPSGEHQLERFERRAMFTLIMDGNNRVSIRLDSMSIRPQGETGAGPVSGAAWSGQTTDARINAMRVTEGGSAAAELTAVVRSLLPRLPVGGVRAQMTWSDSASGAVRVDIFSANERRTAEWSSGALSDRSKLMAVRLREDFEQLGDGSQGGHKLTMTSQGRRSGTYYVTTDGRVSSATIDDSIAMLISIPAMKQVVPTMRYARTFVRFTTANPGETD